jgi:hypothetical protein
VESSDGVMGVLTAAGVAKVGADTVAGTRLWRRLVEWKPQARRQTWPLARDCVGTSIALSAPRRARVENGTVHFRDLDRVFALCCNPTVHALL